jgi:hypothetical protein
MNNFQAPSTLIRQTTAGRNEPYWISLASSDQQYFSGLDASVYFGDVFMGQLVSLDYQVQEMVLPLFAYGDYTMRRAVHGMRVVRGTFTLMFQQVHLMYQLLNYLSGNVLPVVSSPGITKDTTTTKTSGKSLDNTDILTNYINTVPGSVPSMGSLNATQMIDSLSSFSTVVKSKAGLDSIALKKEQLNQIRQTKVTQWTQKQGGTGFDNDGTEDANTGLLANLQGRLSTLFSRYDTAPEGFDIHIELGRPADGSKVTEWTTSGLPIPLSYAQSTANSAASFASTDPKNRIEKALQASPHYTTRKLIGCHVTGMSQSLDDSGRPLTETYGFLATDLI